MQRHSLNCQDRPAGGVEAIVGSYPSTFTCERDLWFQTTVYRGAQPVWIGVRLHRGEYPMMIPLSAPRPNVGIIRRRAGSAGAADSSRTFVSTLGSR